MLIVINYHPCGPRLRGSALGLDIVNTSAAIACVEANLVVDHCDPPLKNSLAYCGHTGAAMTGCGVDVAGVTAPYPLRT